MKHPIICAYDIKLEGEVAELTAEDVSSQLASDAIYRWVHVDLTQAGAKDIIRTFADDLATDALTAEETRPRCSKLENGTILNLRGVNLNPGQDPEDMVSIRIWFTSGFILSARVRKLAAVTDLRNEIDAGRAPENVSSFLARLTQGLTERMDPVIGDLSDQVDALEDRSLESTEGLRAELSDVRRTAIKLRRYVAPQREAISRMVSDGTFMLDSSARIQLSETADKITRIVEEMDAIRERSSILSDRLADRRAEEMNNHMLVLSVVAAIFLPLGFLTGLLGVNIAGIPGASYPLAFLVFCALLIVIGFLLLFLFRRMKWI